MLRRVPGAASWPGMSGLGSRAASPPSAPPFGLLLFVMQGVAPPGTRFGEICLAALPFMGCALLLTLPIVIFPALAVWLPWLGG